MLRYRCEDDIRPSHGIRTTEATTGEGTHHTVSTSDPSSPRRPRRVAASVALRCLVVATSLVAVMPMAASAAPAPVNQPAAKPVRLDDPLADAAAVALSLITADVAEGRGLSARYVSQRATVARLVGERLWTEADDFVTAWSAADVDHQVAIMAALSQVGVPYRKWASKEDEGFDCSGLTMYAWSRAGFDLPHNSTRQIRAAEPRDIFSAQAGDLLRYPGHVMMWLGVGTAIVHSPQPRQYVEVRVLSDRYMRRSAFGDPT